MLEIIFIWTILTINMDNVAEIVKLLENHPRRLNLAMPLKMAGYLNPQRSWVDQPFESCNFSVILRGQGTCTHMGKTWRVKAPCVMIQWPGEHAHYGPDEGSHWEELFFIYPAEKLEQLISSKLFSRDKLFWQIGDKRTLQPLVYEFVDMIEDLTASTELDHLDRLAEQIVMESLFLESSTLKKDEEVISSIVESIQANPVVDYDFDELARKNGISARTFRRKWMKIVEMPPGKFLIRKRIDEACRLLAETQMSVNQIADDLNFTDPLYFRRRFKIETTTTPSEYRRIHSRL